ncbi:unnamed protein product [Aphanomyces euteiches]
MERRQTCHFEKMLQLPETIQVRLDADKGRGLFATQGIEVNSVIFQDEAPIAIGSMDVPPTACCVCKRFVGSIQLQLHVLAEKIDMTEYESKATQKAMEPFPDMTSNPSLPNAPSSSPGYVTYFSPSSSASIVCSKLCFDIVHVQAKQVFGPELPLLLLPFGVDHLVLVAALIGTTLYRLTQQPILDWDAAVADIMSLHAVKNTSLGDEPFQAVMSYFPPETPALKYLNEHMTRSMFETFLGVIQANAVGVDIPSPISRYFASCDENPDMKEKVVKDVSVLVESTLQVLCADEESEGEDENEDEDGSDEDSDDNESGNEDNNDDNAEGGRKKRAHDETVSSNGNDNEIITFTWQRDGAEALKFTSDVFPDSTGMALFPTFSMLNHSCDPNCAIAYVGDSASITVFATKPIASGEELTISYIDHNQAVYERQDELKSRYGFTCVCARCSSSQKSKRKRSDKSSAA